MPETKKKEGLTQKNSRKICRNKKKPYLCTRFET